LRAYRTKASIGRKEREQKGLKVNDRAQSAKISITPKVY